MSAVIKRSAQRIEVNEGAWHHSEFPHPLVTLDYDAGGNLLAVVVIGLDNQPPGAVEALRQIADGSYPGPHHSAQAVARETLAEMGARFTTDRGQ